MTNRPLTRAVVDLDAIRANVREVARLIAPSEVMAVVKANAYGHGLVPVARVAVEAGAARIGVFSPAEARALRAARIGAPILVFGPFTPDDVEDFQIHKVTPTVGSREALDLLASRNRVEGLGVHVEVDTGMSRGGIPWPDAVPLIERIAREPGLTFAGLFTHFADAGSATEPTALRQLAVFRSTLAQLSDRGLRPPVVHAANTAATLSLPSSHFDMVRLGLGLYGLYPNPALHTVARFQPALSLLSTVVQLRQIEAGTGVGYGHDFRAGRPTRLALVPVGYGDGLHRHAGNGNARVLVRGVRAPIVGRVSMDQITVDVTDVPGVSIGDEVVLIGRQEKDVLTAEDMAAAVGTINYEVVTSLLPRVKRLYRERDAGGTASMPSLCPPA